MRVVHALHFLQEHDVRIELAQLLAQLVNHHAPLEVRGGHVHDGPLHAGGVADAGEHVGDVVGHHGVGPLTNSPW